MPTLTLVNWEVEEVSLSALLPAPRVLFSSAARSGGAPNIRTPPRPLPAPQAPQHHARLEKGQDTPIRNAPSPGNINQSWKKDPGTLSWVPNPASTSQYLQPGDAAKLWVLKMGAHGRKGEGGRRMYPAAPAPVHSASAQPRRSAPVLRCRAPIQDGPHPGAMRVPAPVPAWG